MYTARVDLIVYDVHQQAIHDPPQLLLSLYSLRHILKRSGFVQLYRCGRAHFR